MVFGLRFYFRHTGLNKKAVSLPPIKKDNKLPVILNQKELKMLFNAPKSLKHRVVLALIYSAGLRSQEAANLHIADIDFERKTIHIRKSKYNKDRIVPLSQYITKGLRKYLATEKPQTYLFNGRKQGSRYSQKGLSWIMKGALKKTPIAKNVDLHSLRHSYATHLLEQGVNIITVKKLLGHVQIKTTMLYLHIAQCPLMPAHSPLDILYKDAL